MASVSIIEYKGTKILLMDFSNSSDKEQVFRTIGDIKSLAATLPPTQSMRGLVDITGSTYDADIIKGLKEMALHNKPYMKITAVVGVDGIKEILFKAILMFSGRKNLVPVKTREEALEWLITQ